jgi:predicted PurR-regulated permease PerM
MSFMRSNIVSLSYLFRATLVILVALAFAYVLVLTLSVWVSVLVAILVASALRPAILRLTHWRLPQGIAILIVYLGLAVITITLLLIVLPPVINQFVGYIQNDNRLADRIISAQVFVQRTVTQVTGSEFDLGIAPEDIRTSISTIVGTVRVTAPSLIGNATDFLGQFILIIVMGIYWITSRGRAEAFLVELTPLNRRTQISAILNEIESRLGGYVRSIVLVSVIVGFLCFIILTILRIPGAATISFFYAVATAIPIIGGLIGVVLGTFLALLTSPLNAVIVLVVTFLLQQVENYYLTPRMMSEGTDFDPLLVIVFVAMGFSLGGILGSLIAIPIAGTVSILIKHLFLEPRKLQASAVPDRVEGGILLIGSEHQNKDIP